MFSGLTFRRKSKNNLRYIFFFSSVTGCWTVNYIYGTIPYHSRHGCYGIITQILFPVSINRAVTAAEAGGGAEAAGGAGPEGGADSTADRGGPTENQSWRAEGWAGDSEKEASCQHQGSDETTNTRFGNHFTVQYVAVAPSWYSTQLNVTVSLADKEDYTLWEPRGKEATVSIINFTLLWYLSLI